MKNSKGEFLVSVMKETTKDYLDRAFRKDGMSGPLEILVDPKKLPPERITKLLSK